MRKSFIIAVFVFTIILVSCIGSIPMACFELSQDIVLVNDTIEFYNCSENADRYSWNFGDGTTSSLESPKHSYDTTGTFTISLTVYNDDNQNTAFYNLSILSNN